LAFQWKTSLSVAGPPPNSCSGIVAAAAAVDDPSALSLSLSLSLSLLLSLSGLPEHSSQHHGPTGTLTSGGDTHCK
jgi:hypothetical protein